MDRKPSLPDLQAMAHSAKLFECEPSSCHSTNTNTDPPNKPDQSTATLAQIVAAVITSALASTKRMDSLSPSITEAMAQLADLQVHCSACTPIKMDLGCIQVARTARGTAVEAQCKICDLSCVAIEPKFAPMDFSKLTHLAGSKDLGTMVLAQQTMLVKFWTWCHQVDVTYIFQVPSISGFHNHGAVASAPCVSLLTHYKALPLITVLKYPGHCE
jgi:hypothetical protein